jgi:hypothetical protein
VIAVLAWPSRSLITFTAGPQASLWPDWRYHAFVTNRRASAVELDTDHRRHAVCELAIRDLKHGTGLRHCPSGVFLANAAWLVIAALAHNLLRWVAAIGLATSDLVVAKTLRRRLLAMPGRLTRSARRCLLHLPRDWPWAGQFLAALARLQAVPLRTRRSRRPSNNTAAGTALASLPWCPGRCAGWLLGARWRPLITQHPTESPVGTTQQTPDLGVNQAPRWIQA